MKNKVFEKMREYGWNLYDNTNEDFERVYNTHCNFMESVYDYFVDYDMDKQFDLNKINSIDLFQTTCFICDFLRALNEVDKKGEE